MGLCFKEAESEFCKEAISISSRSYIASWQSRCVMNYQGSSRTGRGWSAAWTRGVFGWIALNYATGHLAVNPAPAAESQPSASTTGQTPGV